MTSNKKSLRPLFFFFAVLTATALLLLTDKKAKYDEYDRMMY
jgi:hypothetical protein